MKYEKLWFELNESNEVLGYSIEEIPSWIEHTMSEEDETLRLTHEFGDLTLVSGVLSYNEDKYNARINKDALEIELRDIETYLNQTDWVVIKNHELGTINHQDILDERSSKRIRQQEIQALL